MQCTQIAYKMLDSLCMYKDFQMQLFVAVFIAVWYICRGSRQRLAEAKMRAAATASAF